VKSHIEPITGALATAERLRPVSFEYNDHPGVRRTGLIAQEVEKVLPQLVTTGEDGIKRVRYDLEIQMVMLGAIKELKVKNDALAGENTALRARVGSLESRMARLEKGAAPARSSGLGGGAWGLWLGGLALAGALLLARRRRPGA